MATILSQMIDQLNSIGKKLLEHPCSTSELLSLLDELDRILSKFRQSPSQPVQEALLVSMRALISDDLIRHPNDDVKVAVASCLNEIMRISAPVAPYEDRKMKKYFELIVFSFEKLSSKSSRSYYKAVSILESVAKLRSCVMMLDLDCDPLLVRMFEIFQKNFSSDLPPSVLRAMETIMSIVLTESDTLSLDLVKVLLTSIKKENEHVALISWNIGAKLIEQCSDKLKSYILTAMRSMGSCLQDFAPILSSICKNQPDLVNDCVADSGKNLVNTKDTADKTQGDGLALCFSSSTQDATMKSDSKASADRITESGNAVSKKGKKKPNSLEGRDNRSIKGKLSLKSPHDLLRKTSPFVSKGGVKVISQKSSADRITESGNVGSKKGKKKPNSLEGRDNRSIKGKLSLRSPHDLPKKTSPFVSKGEEKVISPSVGVTPKEETNEMADHDLEQPYQATFVGDSGEKKRKLPKNVGSESMDMALPKSTKRPSKKKKSQINAASKSTKKQSSVDDDVIETPHGRKRYKEDLVGSRIKVWWPLDHKYYEGKISSYDAIKGKHKVDYDDGDQENLNLDKERWEFIGDVVVNLSELFGFMQTCKRSSAKRQRESLMEVKKEASQSNKGKKRSTSNQTITPRKSKTRNETKKSMLYEMEVKKEASQSHKGKKTSASNQTNAQRKYKTRNETKKSALCDEGKS